MISGGRVKAMGWCRSCHHQVPADLQGNCGGDVPLKDSAVPLHQARQSSHQTDDAKDPLGVQPWRRDLP
jgi:hypothetical protein